MKKRVYKSGLPFSEIIATNLIDLYHRVQLYNKAALIIIDGHVGEGKTTLAVHVADFLNKLANLPQIIFEDQLGMGGDEFLEKLRLCYKKKLPVVIYDEAGDFNRRAALTRFNANLNRTFETFRAFKIIPILCLPSFWVLDNDLFSKGIPRLLLHLSKRTNKMGRFKGYSLYRMFYLKKKIQHLTVKPQGYTFVQPNFHGAFLNLEEDRAVELDQFSTAGKLDILQESEISAQGLYSINKICKTLNFSKGKLHLIKTKLKLTPIKKIKNHVYFSTAQYQLIRDNA